MIANGGDDPPSMAPPLMTILQDKLSAHTAAVRERFIDRVNNETTANEVQKIPMTDAITAAATTIAVYKLWAQVHPFASNRECLAELLKIYQAVVDDLNKKVIGGISYGVVFYVMFIIVVVATILLVYAVLFDPPISPRRAPQ